MRTWLLLLLLPLVPVAAQAETPDYTQDSSIYGVGCTMKGELLKVSAMQFSFDDSALISFVGTPEGRIEQAALARTSGNADLDKAAVKCVGHWRFDPNGAKAKLYLGTHTTTIVWARLIDEQKSPFGDVFALRAPFEKPPHADLFPSVCAYPKGAQQHHTPGETLVSYVGSTHGSRDNIKVVRSSGDQELDTFAVECVSQWHFDPSSALGKLDVGPNFINVSWTIGSDGTPFGRRVDIPHQCDFYYPAKALELRLEGTTRVQFTITEEGRVRDVSVLTSSGQSLLDDAALACVATWRYRPAVEGGKPIPVPWKADIVWKAPDLKPVDSTPPPH